MVLARTRLYASSHSRILASSRLSRERARAGEMGRGRYAGSRVANCQGATPRGGGGLGNRKRGAASAAEEYQSINEELQSSNEELETAKEEMQSINEEIQTVNAELNNKNDQLMRSNSDLQNLLDSTEIGTVFLDNKLRVKGYTLAITELFHLRDSDRGRPLDEVVSRTTYGDLRADVMSVLRDANMIEREVEIESGSVTFIMRIRPYRTLDRAVDGVVMPPRQERPRHRAGHRDADAQDDGDARVLCCIIFGSSDGARENSRSADPRRVAARLASGHRRGGAGALSKRDARPMELQRP